MAALIHGSRHGSRGAAALVPSARALLMSALAFGSLFEAVASSAAILAADGRSLGELDMGAMEVAPSGVSAAGRQLEVANWDIFYDKMSVELAGDGADMIRLTFDIGKDRAFVTRTLAKGCDTDITGVVLAPTTPVRAPSLKGDALDFVGLAYSFDTGLLPGSNLWDANATTMEFCHVLTLVVPNNTAPTGSPPLFELTRDVREITIPFNMSVDFAVTQELVAEREFMGMTITGCFNITDVFLPVPTPEEMQRATDSIKQAFEEHVGEILQDGQQIFNVTISIAETPNPDRDSERPKAQCLIDVIPLILVDFTACFEIVLLEQCQGDCATYVEDTRSRLRNGQPPTMFENVVNHVTDSFNNGEFVDTMGDDIIFACSDILVDNGTDPFEEDPDIFQPVTGSGIIRDSVSFAHYIYACVCDDAQSFSCNGTDYTLSPNDELLVCIRSLSSDVRLASLNSMVLVQGDKTLGVIDLGDQIVVNAITSREYVPDKNGVAVSTRVPMNLFEFGDGQFITISGKVTTKFAGTRRELQTAANLDGPSLQTDDAGARFQLKVKLVEDLDAVGEPIKASPLDNSAAFVGQCVGVMGLVLIVLYISSS